MQTAKTLRDRYGLALSTASPAAAEHYIEAIDRMLSLNAGIEEGLQRAIEADAGFALPHAALALFRQSLGRTEEAKADIEQARVLAAGTTPREQRQIETIAASIAGEGPRALRLAREQLAEFPRDVVLLYQASGLISGSGSPRRLRERFALHEELAPAYGEDWWFLSSFSFAHHELDLLDEARRLSQRSIALFPRNANASHNLAHVFYETDDHAGGVDFLGEWIAAYDRQAPFHCHLSWHLALFELAGGHYERAMSLYRRSVDPSVGRQRTTLEDASSLLWRWQIYGCGGETLPWAGVCELANGKVAKPGVVFADVHAALAFAAAGEEAALNRLVDGLRALAAKGHPLAGSVTLPLVLGVSAFARGEYEQTIRELEPAAAEVERIGGSHAQREVFEDTLLEAYLRTGRYEQAEALLRTRLERRGSARDFFWLGRAQAGAGESAAARASLARARERWQGADATAPEQQAVARLLAGA